MNENSIQEKLDALKNKEPIVEEKLLETDVSERLVLEHPTYKQLENTLTEAEAKSNEAWNKMLRMQADFENLQRRAERDVANAHKYSLEKFAFELLGVIDNLERAVAVKVEHEALKDFYVGVEMTLKSFLEILQKNGIIQICPMGAPFNPEQHTAVTTKEGGDYAANTVIEVMQKGYWLKDRLLRPALVVVAK